MRTALMTLFTIALLVTALGASALGAIGSPGDGTTLKVIDANIAAERQVDGTQAALPPPVLLPPTSGAAPVTVLLPQTSGSGSVIMLPSTSTAPPSGALLSVLMAGAGVAAGLTLLVMGRRRR